MRTAKKTTVVKVVEWKRLKIPIYYSPLTVGGKKYKSYQIAYYRGGKRVRERRGTLPKMTVRAKEVAEELGGENPPDSHLTANQVKAVNTAAEILAPLDIPITEAARLVVEAEKILGGRGTIIEAARALVEKSKANELMPITFGDLYAKFMSTLATEGKDAKSRTYLRSFRYWQDCSQRLGAAADFFKNRLITEVSTRDLESFLDEFPLRRNTKGGVIFTGKFRKITGRTRNNYRTAFCTLFSYARKRRYLPRNVETEAENMLGSKDNISNKQRAESLNRRIYTPLEMQRILDNIPDRWIPFVALGAFAGIRAAEIHRLTWKDIKFEDKHVEIDRFRAKVGRRRLVPISPQLRAWLKPHAKDDGCVCPHYSHDSTLNIAFTSARSKIDVPFVHNGHRHSYASYRLTETDKNTSLVAWEMNTSERKLKDNYVSLVNNSQVALWKKVLPKSGKRLKNKSRSKSQKAQSENFQKSAEQGLTVKS
ncbi:MAG: tyrosine-type recombinase/integrase [Terrimicrobiaceae bacterium]